jgi:chromosome segregation ATPase
MALDINMELVKLQDELNLLDEAVKQIEKAGVVAISVVDSTKEITLRFGDHLAATSQKVDEALKQSQAANDASMAALVLQYQQQIEKVNVFLENYKGLTEAVAKLQPQIEKVDFPARFDKLNQDISAVNTTIAMTTKLMDNLEGKMKAQNDTVAQLSRKVNSQSGEVKLLVFLVFIVIAVALAGFGLQYFKVF